MHKDLNKIKNSLMTMQFIVFLGVLVGCVLVFSFKTIERANQGLRQNLNNTAYKIHYHITQKLSKNASGVNEASLETLKGDLSLEEYLALTKIQENVLSADKSTAISEAQSLQMIASPYLDADPKLGIYVINQYGEFIMPRVTSDILSLDLWEAHRTKLIYEMQKQKEGWTAYPELTTWDWKQEQQVIRYLPVESKNWIIAVESHQPSQWFLLWKHLDVRLAFYLSAVILICFLTMRLFTFVMFKRAERIVNKVLNNNYMNLQKTPFDMQQKFAELKSMKTALDRSRRKILDYELNTEQLSSPEPKKQEDEQVSVAPKEQGEKVSIEQWFYRNKMQRFEEADLVDEESQEEPQEKSTVSGAKENVGRGGLKDVKLPLLKKLLSDMRQE